MRRGRRRRGGRGAEVGEAQSRRKRRTKEGGLHDKGHGTKDDDDDADNGAQTHSVQEVLSRVTSSRTLISTLVSWHQRWTEHRKYSRHEYTRMDRNGLSRPAFRKYGTEFTIFAAAEILILFVTPKMPAQFTRLSLCIPLLMCIYKWLLAYIVLAFLL